jgi:hypothetical protein
METSSRFPWGKGTPRWVRDATLNDSDKPFTVPAGKIWKLIGIWIDFTASGVAGNRILQVNITNGTDNIFIGPKSAAIATGVVAEYVLFKDYNVFNTLATNAPWLANGGTANIASIAPMPELYLPAGYVVRAYDYAAVDAAADDMTVVLHYIEYDA